MNSTEYIPVMEKNKKHMQEDLVYRLRKRAEIRRQIPSRKSVQEGKQDRLADLLDEAANEIDKLQHIIAGLVAARLKDI